MHCISGAMSFSPTGKRNLFRDFQRVQIYSIAHKNQKRITAGTHSEVLLTLSRRHSQKSFVIDVRLVNLLVESTRRKSHTAHHRFLNQY